MVVTKQIKKLGKILISEKAVFGYIIAFAVLTRVLFLLKYEGVWWDEAIYVGMGKYLASAGASGLWEIFRPLGLPVMSSIIWLAGLDVLATGRIIAAAISVCVIALTYLIGKKVSSNAWTGVLAAAFVAAAPVFFSHSKLWLSAIPSTLFATIAVLFFVSGPKTRNLILAGFFAALAVLTRFQQGVLIFALVGGLAVNFLLQLKMKKAKKLLAFKKLINQGIVLCASWFITVLPYLVFNELSYGSAFSPLFEAQKMVSVTAAFYGSGRLFYFRELFVQNPLFVFAAVGAVMVVLKLLNKKSKETDYRSATLLIAVVLFLAYFTWMAHKEARFLLEFLPYVAILSSLGIIATYDLIVSKLKFTKKERLPLMFFMILILAGAIVAGAVVHASYLRYAATSEPQIVDEYYRYFVHNEINSSEMMYATSPAVTIFISNPLYVMPSVDIAAQTLSAGKEKIRYMMTDTCDLLCPPGDTACEELKTSVIADIKSMGQQLFYKNESGCEYIIISRE